MNLLEIYSLSYDATESIQNKLEVCFRWLNVSSYMYYTSLKPIYSRVQLIL